MSEKLFSERLSESLKASGLSQSEVAKQAGITAPYLSDLKKGKRGNPSSEVVRKLAAALRTTPFWLMGYEDEEHPTHYQKENGAWHLKEPQVAPVPDARREATLAASREFNAALEPKLRSLVRVTLRKLDAGLSTAAVNDGESRAAMLRLCHGHVEQFAAELEALRAGGIEEKNQPPTPD